VLTILGVAVLVAVALALIAVVVDHRRAWTSDARRRRRELRR
jgi:hypothetical protein